MPGFSINHENLCKMEGESTCFKTLKLQNFCKMFGERCETGAPL